MSSRPSARLRASRRSPSLRRLLDGTPRRSSLRRVVSTGAAAVVASALLVTLPLTPASAADPAVVLDKSVPETSLAGKPITYSLKVTNPTGGTLAGPAYNVGFRDELPVGLRYVASSSSANLGEPKTFINTTTGRQTLVWPDVSDLADGETRTFTFQAETDYTNADLSAAGTAVGRRLENAADVYGHTNPRLLPKFDGQLRYVASTADITHRDTAPTTLTALKITKREPSPEHELLRGVHNHPTQYTLEVENTGRAATINVQVVDFLPAELEFLGCGTADNSPEREYPGAAALTQTPDVTNCDPADRVETVELESGNPQKLPAGVYTKVTWNLETLAARSKTTIVYAAGIAQRENTMTFPGGTPSATSGAQGSNLGNNTGPSTRELGSENAITNVATVTGNYSGSRVSGTPILVTDSTELTVTVEDVAVQKSGSTGSFRTGGEITHTLDVQTSEYVEADTVSVTDTLPDGMCFAASGGGCATSLAGLQTTGNMTPGTLANDNGVWRMTMTTASMGVSDTERITYKARMSPAHANSAPTVDGDAFTNTVALTAGTTSPAAVQSPEGTTRLAVTDDSAHTIASDGPALVKTIQPDVAPDTTMTCSTTGSAYQDPAVATTEDFTFSEGSKVCFRLRVDFSDINQTRNVALVDFLPANTTYVDGSAQVLAGSMTMPPPTLDGDTLTWQLGSDLPTGRYVAAGAVFDVVFALTLNGPSTNRAVDKTANLARLRWENTKGSVNSLRDEVDYTIAATPEASIAKSAKRVNRGTADAPVAEGANVGAGETLEYTVQVANGDADRSLRGIQVWDVLPAGVSCEAVDGISDSGVCTNPGAGQHPTFTGAGTLSALRWTIPGPLAATQNTSVTYRVTFPADASVSTTYLNKAAIRTYTSRDNQQQSHTHYPTSNIDASVNTGPSEAMDVPEAQDTHSVKTSDASIVKTVASESGLNNDNAGQGAIGEKVTWTVTATVPAHTTLYQGRIVDTLPAGYGAWDEPASGTVEEHVAGSWVHLVGSSFVHSGASSQQFQAILPTIAAGASPRELRFVIETRVLDTPANVARKSWTNTATLTSTTTENGSTAGPEHSASVTSSIVEPSPVVTKGHDKGTKAVAAGETITYTLTADSAGPTLHGITIFDCLPAGLEFISSAAGVAPYAGSGHGCAPGTTPLSWNNGLDLNPASNWSATYTGKVRDAAAGAELLANTVTLTGTSRPGTQKGERTYTTGDVADVRVEGASIDKSTSTPNRTIGDRAEYSVEVTLPAEVNFHDLSITDTLPAGFGAGDVDTTSAICVQGGVPCAAPAITPSELPAIGQKIGWFLGDMVKSTQERVITVVYTVPVTDASTVLAANSPMVNTASAHWNVVNTTNPSTVDTPWTMPSEPITDTASVTIQEPSLSITKSASDTTPAPGEEFGYTLRVTNAAGAKVTTAHDAVVTDTVPLGIVVKASSISHGGTLVGADAVKGGGVITWPAAATVAAGASFVRTYLASLSSPVITGNEFGVAGLRNTAKVAEYHSQPAGGGREYATVPVTATVTPQLPRVTLAKTAANPTTRIGSETPWTITATNVGSAPAHGVDVTDVLPKNWTYVEGSARIGIGSQLASITEPTVTSVGGVQTLVWEDAAAELAVGHSVVIVLKAVPTAAAADAPGVGLSVDHVNTATVVATDAEGATESLPTPSGPGTKFTGPHATAKTSIASADLAIVKGSTATPVAGTDFSWTIDVSNLGPDPASVIRVVDTLPAGATFVSGAGTGWNVTHSNGEIVASSTGSLASGAAAAPITITVRLDAGIASGTEITNTAVVSGPLHDPVTSNNTSSDTITTTSVSDLSIAKVVRPGSDFVAGKAATWELTVTNHGPSDNQGTTTVTETLPAGVTGASASGADWDCKAPAGGTIVCETDETIVVGGTSTLTVTGTLPSGRTTGVTNTAEVDGPDDTTPGNDTGTVTTPPGASADVAISKRQVTSKLVPGKPVEYLLTVVNNGPSDAAGVTVTDVLPAALSHDSSTPSVGTCTASGQAVNCVLGTLAAGDSETITIVADLSPDAAGVLINTAAVTTSTTDPVPANNIATVISTGAAKEVDLTVAKRHTGAAEVKAGEDTTFELVVTNDGPSRSVGEVTVTDVLPAGLEYVSATGTGWTVRESNGTITATSTGDIARGASAPAITVTVKVLPDAGPATITNTAVVSGTEPDPDLTNNSDDADVVVVDDAELTLVKTTTATGPVVAGDEVEFTLAVRNAGPSDADDVTVVDSLPAGMTLVEASGSGWDCDTAPGTCSRPVLAAGETATITVVALVASGVLDGENLENTATVTTTTPGDDPADNTDTADVDVIARADLGVTKKHVSDTTVAGETTAFEVKVTNHGLSDAVGPITITDALPSGMTFVKATSTGDVWTCDPTDPAAPVCTLTAGLVAGEKAPTLTLEVAIAVSQPAGVVTNEVSVTSATTDPVPGNDTDTADAEVTRKSDLSIVKTHTGTPRVGDEITFTLEVRNDGPSTATGVTVTDPMPKGLELVSVAGVDQAASDWVCTDVEGDARCVLDGALAVGETAELITVTAKVKAAAHPSVTNVAVLEGNEKDPEKENNTSSDKVLVPAKVDLSITKKLRGELEVGTTAVYELTVTNHGPTADPSRITVTDVLPEGLTFVEAAGKDVLCTAVDGTLACVVPSLASGESSTVEVTVQVGAKAYPSITNTATVASDSEDTDPTNNTDSVTSVVPAKVDLVISKKSRGKFVVGEQGTYEITVSNRGLTADPDTIVVTDVLPKGLKVAEASGEGLTCETIAGRMTCSIAGLDAGESRTATLTVDIGRNAYPSVMNTVTLATSSVDTDLSNNTDVDIKKVTSSTGIQGAGDESDGAGGAGSEGSSGSDGGSDGNSGGDGILPNAGGPALGWALLALLMVAGGTSLLRRRRA